MRKIGRKSEHGIFGQNNNDSVSESCNHLGYVILKGSMNLCYYCRESKPKKQQNAKSTFLLNLGTEKKPRKCSTVKRLTQPVWRLIVDDYT